MPGGKNIRQWYAIREALKRQGKWTGQEEGEPEPKRTEGKETVIGYGKNKNHIFIGSKCWVDENIARYRAKPSALHEPPEEKEQEQKELEEPKTPDSLPELEAPPTDEGKTNFYLIFVDVRSWPWGLRFTRIQHSVVGGQPSRIYVYEWGPRYTPN